MTKKASLTVAFITVAIDLLGFGIMIPLLPRYAERFQGVVPDAWQGVVIGLLMCSFSLVQFIFAPFWGRLSDRLGRRPIILVGLAGSSATYFLFAYATSIESLFLLFLARSGQGLCGATISTAQAIVADCTAVEERSKGMALIGMAFGIGFTLGPVLGAVWVTNETAGPPSAAPGVVAGILSLCAWLVAYCKLEETLKEGVTGAERSWLGLQGLKFMMRHSGIWLPTATFFIAILAFGLFEGTISRMTHFVMQYTDRQNFYVFFVIGLTLTLTQGFIVRKLAPIWGEVSMIHYGLFFMTLGMAGIAWAVSGNLTILIFSGLIFIVIGFAFLTPNVQALISRRSDSNHQGEMLGLLQSTGAVARIFGPFLGNVLYGRPSAPEPALPYTISAILLGGSLLVALGVGLGRHTEGTAKVSDSIS